jgi:hypothetical protein
MDELLALMEDDHSPEEEPPPQVSEGAGIDALVSVMEEKKNPGKRENQPSSLRTPLPPPYSRRSTLVTPSSNSGQRQPTRSSRPTTKQPAANHAPPPPSNKNQPVVDVSVDDKLGIRMLKRMVSSVDLLDLLSTNPYFTPACLSAMCLSRLAKLLVDPPQIVDRATISGKTHLVTVGIVFSNTGTRISAKGGAFCVLTIGNFTSGPCVSVLLFGDAYSKHCRTCVAGKVVALINPKLLPPKTDSDTSLSVSVTDASHMQLVATAQDYGVCKASGLRRRQPNGEYMSNGNCKNYVDKRKCEYCDTHLKQRHQTSSSNMRVAAGGALPKQGGMTFVQKMRFESAPPTQNNVQGKNNIIVRNNKESTGSNNRFLNPEPTSNSFLNPSSAATGPHAGRSAIPMHMKKKEPLAVRSGNARMLSSRKGAGESSNRLLNGSVKPPAPQTTTKPKQRGIIGAGDWLQTGTSSKRQPPSSLAQLAAKKKQRSINTVGAGGWDGSVAVPKPCRLFQGKVPTKLLAKSSSTASSIAAQQEAAAERIRQQQSEVALRRRKEQAVPVNPYDSRKGKPVSRAQQFDDFFSNNVKLNVDTEKVLNAKSRFASEADAENYLPKSPSRRTPPGGAISSDHV